MTPQSLFDRDIIQPTEWDSRTVRSAERDVTRRFHKGDHQSALAHQSIEPKKTAMQAQIHAYVGSKGKTGATCQEIERDLGLKHQTASARCSEMQRPDAEFRIYRNGLTRALPGSRPARAYVTSMGQVAP